MDLPTALIIGLPHAERAKLRTVLGDKVLFLDAPDIQSARRSIDRQAPDLATIVVEVSSDTSKAKLLSFVAHVRRRFQGPILLYGIGDETFKLFGQYGCEQVLYRFRIAQLLSVLAPKGDS